MKDFVFHNKTKVYFGKKQLGHLREEIAIFGKKVLLVYGIETLGLKSKLSDLGIDDKNFAAMAKNACGNGVLHGFTDLTPDDVEKIYKMCL